MAYPTPPASAKRSSRHSTSMTTSSSLPFFPKPGHITHSHSLSHRIVPADTIPRSSSVPPTDSLVSHADYLSNANEMPMNDPYYAEQGSPGSLDIPTRSTSLRRKPVPSFIPLPAPAPPLPSSHPFARSSSAPGQPGSAATPGVYTPSPGTQKMEEDLFFQPPNPNRGGPRPPRRIARDPRESPTGSIPSSPSSLPITASVPPPPLVLHSTDGETESGVASTQGENTSAAPPASGASAAMDRESSLRAREEELRRKEDEMRLREADFLMRRKEAELREREEALREREERLARLQAATPSFSSDHHHETQRQSVLQPTQYTRGQTPLPISPDTLNRSLPRLPDPSQSALYLQSTESFSQYHAQSPVPTTGPMGAASSTQTEKRIDGASVTSNGHGSHAQHRLSQPQPPRPSLIPGEYDEENQVFSVDRLPSKRRLWEAGTHFLKDEEGKLVCFGDLFPQYDNPYGTDKPIIGHSGQEGEDAGPPIVKTVVFFIRHFWCGQCQDYTFASLSLLDPVAIRKAGIRVVVISNGSWKIIKAYRRILNCPFPIYVDGPRRLYQLLGMTKMTNDFGPMFSGRAAYHQRPVPTQLLHGLGNAFFRFPLADPGKLTQLGGEFIFTPGYNCQFAHRMTTTSDHMEAPDVMRIAGVAHPTSTEIKKLEIVESQREELARLEEEMRVWRENREAELDRIRRRKAERRGEAYTPTRRQSQYGMGIDEELGETILPNQNQNPDLHPDDLDFVGQDDSGQEVHLDDGEYTVVGRPKQVAFEPELEGRFNDVMRFNEGRRLEEHEEAVRVAEGRGNLDVRVVR